MSRLPLNAQSIHENSNLAFTSAARARSSCALGEQRLQRVLEFVEANLETDISVDDLASVAFVSKFHFSRVFRRATGQTPHQFVRARRLEKQKNCSSKET
jgi:AraC family transcriptional regulator